MTLHEQSTYGWLVLAAGGLHVAEEYWLPGGFLREMRQINPRAAAGATPRFAVAINGGFLLALLGAALPRRRAWWQLAAGMLVGLNGLVHCGAALRKRGYTPGLATAGLLYLPLAVWGWRVNPPAYRRKALLTALGLHAVPVVWLLLAALHRGRGDGSPGSSCLGGAAPAGQPARFA